MAAKPEIEGEWESSETFNVPDQTRYDRDGKHPVTDTRGLFVLHSVLLHTGKVLVFCGHVENADYGGNTFRTNPDGSTSPEYRGVSYVFDPENPGTTASPMTPIYFPIGTDLFCCHYVQIQDGRILVVGGSVTNFHHHGSVGAKNICFFDPVTEKWELSKTGSATNFLSQGRWYPTAVLLGNGSVAIFSGRDEGRAEVDTAGDPIFRLGTRLGPEVFLPIIGGIPLYVTPTGNEIELEISGAGIPYHEDPRGAMWLVLQPNVAEPEASLFFFYNPVTNLVYEGEVVSGTNTFTEVSGVAVSSLDFIIQRRYWISEKVEVATPADNYATSELAGADFELPIYPGMHLVPDGRIFFSGTNWGQEIPNPPTRALVTRDPITLTSWEDFGGALSPGQPNREEAMSVLLPPAQDGKILLFGGATAVTGYGVPIMQILGPTLFNRISEASDPVGASDPKSAEILDTKASGTLAWTPTADLSFGRINGHAVILPDMTTLILGGHDNYKWRPSNSRTFPNCRFPTGQSAPNTTTPSNKVEIFDGTTFTTGAEMTHPRMYHSTALLLPDGRVMIAGGADPNDVEPPLFTTSSGEAEDYPTSWNGPRYYAVCRDGSGTPLTDSSGRRRFESIPLNRKDYQMYKPPYFFKGPRPIIMTVGKNQSSTNLIGYGDSFQIITSSAAIISAVAFMRPGAPTHHTDSEQRYVSLEFTYTGANEITAVAPSEPNLAPPGYYMLWIMTEAQEEGKSGLVPCERAYFIRLTP